MDAFEMKKKLDNVPQGSKIFVSYIAGRPPTVRAVREASRSVREGIPKRYYFGTFDRVRMTKRGEFIMTMLCENRDDERNSQSQAFRSFNPNLGELITLEVLEEAGENS